MIIIVTIIIHRPQWGCQRNKIDNEVSSFWWHSLMAHTFFDTLFKVGYTKKAHWLELKAIQIKGMEYFESLVLGKHTTIPQFHMEANKCFPTCVVEYKIVQSN